MWGKQCWIKQKTRIFKRSNHAKHFGDVLFNNIIKYLCSILSLQSLALYGIFSILEDNKCESWRDWWSQWWIIKASKTYSQSVASLLSWFGVKQDQFSKQDNCGTPRSGLAVGAQVGQAGFPNLVSSGGSTELPSTKATKGKAKNLPWCFWHSMTETVGWQLFPLLVWKGPVSFHWMQNNLRLCSFLQAGRELAWFCWWILLVPLGTGGAGSQQLSYRGQGCFRVLVCALSDGVCCRIGWGLEEGQESAFTWGNFTLFSKSIWWKGCGSPAVAVHACGAWGELSAAGHVAVSPGRRHALSSREGFKKWSWNLVDTLWVSGVAYSLLLLEIVKFVLWKLCFHKNMSEVSCDLSLPSLYSLPHGSQSCWWVLHKESKADETWFCPWWIINAACFHLLL